MRTSFTLASCDRNAARITRSSAGVGSALLTGLPSIADRRSVLTERGDAEWLQRSRARRGPFNTRHASPGATEYGEIEY